MDRQLFAYDPDLAYRLIPGLRTRIEHPETGGYLFRTNEAGFRSDREFVSETKSGKIRALVFGDSFTMGPGVSARQRYSERLEALIPGLETYNFGLSGTGPDQHFLTYKKAGRNLDHDIVVLGFWVENIVRSTSRYRFARSHSGEELCLAKPYFTLAGDRLKLHNTPVPKHPVPLQSIPRPERRFVASVPRRIEEKGRPDIRVRRAMTALAVRARIRREIMSQYSSARTEAWRLVSAILGQWADESPVPMVIMLMPLREHVLETASPRNYQRRFRELAADRGLVVHDTLPDVLELSHEDRLQLYFRDGHPTSAYHSLLAESLAPALKTSLAEKASV